VLFVSADGTVPSRLANENLDLARMGLQSSLASTPLWSRPILATSKTIFLPLGEAALFLDLDGTLAPLAARPNLVGPDPVRNELLQALAIAMHGRVAIISGRSIEEIDRIVGSCIPCVAGLHGLQRRGDSGRLETSAPHPNLDQAVSLVEAFGRSRPDLLIENKSLGVAMHFREAPDLADETIDFARRVAWMTGLKLQEGDMVAELRSPGANKGDMVRTFMTERPFAGGVPVFVGDDITDEDGFAAAREAGGVGVLVGARRDTYATCHLPNVRSVLAWIDDALSRGAFELAVSP
jgi:trehalose 6-phosphate phosphatase